MKTANPYRYMQIDMLAKNLDRVNSDLRFFIPWKSRT